MEVIFQLNVSSNMISKSSCQSSKEVHKKPADNGNTCSKASTYCESVQSEIQRNQRKHANRSPASRGYPKECIGDFNQYLKTLYLI